MNGREMVEAERRVGVQKDTADTFVRLSFVLVTLSFVVFNLAVHGCSIVEHPLFIVPSVQWRLSILYGRLLCMFICVIIFCTLPKCTNRIFCPQNISVTSTLYSHKFPSIHRILSRWNAEEDVNSFAFEEVDGSFRATLMSAGCAEGEVIAILRSGPGVPERESP